MSKGTQNRQGIVFALISAVLFGASTPLAKALSGGVSPWMLAGYLYLASGIGLAAVRYLRPGVSAEAKLTINDIPWLVAVVLAGGVAGPVLLMAGLSATSASAASLLLNLEGVFTLAIAWVAFRENVDRRIAIGAAAILAGALLLSWDGSVSGLGWGSLAIAGACLAWGVDNNLTRKLSAADPLQIAMIKGLAAGSVNVAIAWTLGMGHPAPVFFVGGAVVGFLGYGVSLTLFVLALRHLGSARTGAYFSMAPFVGAVLSVMLFGEPVTQRLFAAAVLMGAGLVLHLVEHHEHPHRHDPVRHDHRHTHDEHHRHVHEGWEGPEPHSHAHNHAPLVHTHAHYPDIHHRHGHKDD